MEILTIKNKEILDICEKFTTLEYHDGTSAKPNRWAPNETYEQALVYATSDQTLDYILAGKPYVKKSHYKIFGETTAGQYFLDNLKSIIDFDRYYTACYWPQGFVGWHNDGDIQGYCLLWTWNRDGKGFFKYRDPVTKQIITVEDPPGWHVKAMRLGSQDHDLVWHCAGGSGSRYSFVIFYDDINHQKFLQAKQII
jgi:hypothetical protein